MSATTGVETVDLASTPLRELNQRLHDQADAAQPIGHWQVLNPSGAHALACGLDAPLEVEIMGHAGYYCAGMNKQATVTLSGMVKPTASACRPFGLTSLASRQFCWRDR